ncbi:sorbitol dehydrogenase (L-iditol 2-dehydrogenase) [Oceanobacillus iheyensis HTE831]|uniref:Sorbitol dehydrogenase (L-iditol 2-dehydrogenase) n=1 Tax=Oceanobacillus iheyensis (strain DSM 14371 / CIP 107618 / JCM 11309 / KCTC 3954 / HTE831) TaxID=221109 RepID=Q8ELI9_OCEIH|nr:alcohol dehydrogenase catalytic domain-containing protein [Oceanobacillus iheyensis]BAC15194.1 sorbitol dehydrogenase (L-iditol 2-dehydrogenase) [Oceanobacillus iheyensis HTE831]
MNGLYLSSPGVIEFRELASRSKLSDDEVRIRLIYGGICGSDISVFKGKLPHANYPVVPGHELIGTVIETGKSAADFAGKRVAIMPNSFCGKCEYCKVGKTNICTEKQSLGINRDGGFAEEFVISAKYVLSLPDQLTNEKAVLIEPLAVIVHAMKKVVITEETKVAIIGCGNEGMLAIAVAEYLGAQVTAIDVKQNKLNKVSHSYHNVSTCQSADAEELFDVVIEAAGTSESFEQGIQLLKPGGAFVAIGMPPHANLPVVEIVRKEVTIYGSIIYNFPEDFNTSIEFLLQEDFQVEPVISKILSVNEYEKAYTYAVSGDYGKIILKF